MGLDDMSLGVGFGECVLEVNKTAEIAYITFKLQVVIICAGCLN